MTTYTLSQTSSLNTVLKDPQGNAVYEISTPLKVGNSQTTIKRGDREVATIQWKILERNTITMNGKTTTVKDIFPRVKRLGAARVWTMPNGHKYKWKGTNRLQCISLDTNLKVATYHRTWFHLFRSKPSTLEIATELDAELTDFLIVTWVIAEKKAKDRRGSRPGPHGGGASADN